MPRSPTCGPARAPAATAVPAPASSTVAVARGGPPHVAALAKELGVTQAKLSAALQKVRGNLVKEHEAERDAFITKLAAKLGVSEAKVKEVIGARPHHGRRGP